jgi:hypothetical protein
MLWMHPIEATSEHAMNHLAPGAQKEEEEAGVMSPATVLMGDVQQVTAIATVTGTMTAVTTAGTMIGTTGIGASDRGQDLEGAVTADTAVESVLDAPTPKEQGELAGT